MSLSTPAATEPSTPTTATGDTNKLYQPLDVERSEIRLLEIISATPKQAGIQLKLHTVSLKEQAPSFTALSYVAADDPGAAEREAVSLNGTSISVTANLARALRVVLFHFKKLHPFRRSRKFRIWVDALCINEADAVERGRQVELQRDIFQRAETVFGSITPSVKFDDASIDLSFETITLLEKEFKKIKTPDELLQLKWCSRYEQLRREEPGSSLGNKTWEALWRFQESRYFKRVWIRQEMCLARRLIFVHGERSVEFANVAVVYYVLDMLASGLNEKVTDTVSLAEQSNVGGKILNTLMSWVSDFMVISSIRGALTLRPTLGLRDKWIVNLMAVNTTASSPKDYVYGLLGLTSLPIRPDYTTGATLSQIYSKYITTWLEDYKVISKDENFKTEDNEDLVQELFFLRMSGLNLAVEGHKIPSWAPAYHQSKPLSGFLLTPTETCAKFPALVDADAATLELLDLTASGVTIDEIKTVFDKPIAELLGSDELLAFCAEYTERYPKTRSQPVVQAIFRASTAINTPAADPDFLSQSLTFLNLFFGAKLDTPEEGELREAYDQRCAKLGLAQPDDFQTWYKDNFSSAQEEALTKLGTKLPVISEPQRKRLAVPLKWLGESYRLVETKSGYLGHAPKASRPGDSVAIIKGSQVLSVLRKELDWFVNVGGCWIYEYMSPEAEKIVKASDNKVERLTIK